jgi:hypothetical protein
MSNNVLTKIFVAIVGFVMLLQISFSAAQIVDIEFSELVSENVLYNPLQTSSGLYADAGENQSSYTASGTIVVRNPHATQAVQNVLLNVSGITTLNGVTYLSGAQGYVSEYNTAGNYMMLYIPDLGAGQNTTFNYTINVSQIAPPLNLTTTYSDNRIFAGLPITIFDTFENVMNASLYTNNCIYNITVASNALTINNSGTLLNVTFDNTSLAGTDASNASFTADNRTVNWNVRALGCLNAGNTTDINYIANTPSGVNQAGNYQIVNTSYSYQYNGTFSRIALVSATALVDLDVEFEKYLNNTLTGDNATWRIYSQVSNPSDVDVNLTQVSLWVSVRNGTGTGFTNPSIIDNDTISGASLTTSYTPNILLNSSTGNYNNSGNEWFFNYTFSASPIVWMDVVANVIDDGLQLQNRSVSYGQNNIYIKELYLATGYWLEVKKNITRLSNSSYNVFIQVTNLGTSATPSGQAVQVYNFIPNTFNLTSAMVFSTSTWYNTQSTNTTLNDPTYNGTMFQFALLPTNAINASLDAYGGAPNANNTWSVTYNVSGTGEFQFDDLFLTGVDPLNVGEAGATKAVVVEGDYSFVGAKVEYILGVLSIIIAALVFLV